MIAGQLRKSLFVFTRFLCLGIIAFCCFSAVLSSGVFGQSIAAPVAESSTERLGVMQEIDPECKQYGRCDQSFNSTFGTIFISSFREKLMSPGDFLVSGNVSFTWIPEAYPGWNPDQLILACRIRDCDFPGWTSVSTFSQGFAQVWTANFATVIKESTSFEHYPFDQHWVHLKLVGKDSQSQRFISMLDVASYHIEISSGIFEGVNSDFVVDYATASQDVESSNNFISTPSLPLVGNVSEVKKVPSWKASLFSNFNPSDSSSFVISLRAKRRIPAALWMVVVPLLLILLNTILAFHWRENSPASRFGSSGLLTAVSLFFASRIFRPDVDYLVFTDLWFLSVFVMITINNILLIWLFRFYKHRSSQKTEGLRLKPAYQMENKLTLMATSIILVVISLLGVMALFFSNFPRNKITFLGWRNDYSATGASAVRVFDQSSFYSDQGGFLPYSSPE